MERVGRPRKYPKGTEYSNRHVVMSMNLETNKRFTSCKEAYETKLGIKLSKSQFLQALLNKWDG